MQGETVVKDEGKAEIFNAFFALVFISKTNSYLGTKPAGLDDRG